MDQPWMTIMLRSLSAEQSRLGQKLCVICWQKVSVLACSRAITKQVNCDQLENVRQLGQSRTITQCSISWIMSDSSSWSEQAPSMWSTLQCLPLSCEHNSYKMCNELENIRQLAWDRISTSSCMWIVVNWKMSDNWLKRGQDPKVVCNWKMSDAWLRTGQDPNVACDQLENVMTGWGQHKTPKLFVISWKMSDNWPRTGQDPKVV